MLVLARTCAVYAPAHLVSTNAVYNRYLAARAKRFDRWNHMDDVELEGHMDGDLRLDARGPTSDHPELGGLLSQMALFRWSLYERCLAGSCSLSWPFSLT
jgi:hypothetical protein